MCVMRVVSTVVGVLLGGGGGGGLLDVIVWIILTAAASPGDDEPLGGGLGGRPLTGMDCVIPPSDAGGLGGIVVGVI